MTEERPTSIFERMTGSFPSALVLFATAKRSYERCGVSTKPVDVADAALTTVLFSALAIEAFLNELADLAQQFGQAAISDPPSVAAYAAGMAEVEDSKASPRLKLQLAALLLAGAPFDRGAQPYRDFRLLFTIRDFLAHHKPVHVTWSDRAANLDRPGLIRELQCRHLLPDRPPGMASSLLHDIAEPAVAAWALRACARVVQDLIERIPPGTLREFSKLVYGREFVVQG